MAILSVVVMIGSLILGQPIGVLLATAGVLIAWLLMKPSSPVVAPIQVTNVGDDFDQFVHEQVASPPPTAAIAPVTRDREVPNRARQDLGDGVGYELGIVGEAYYMPELRALGARRSDPEFPLEFVATLVRQPTNPHDPNAIAVLSDRGNAIGYLSRSDAVAYGPVLAAVEIENKTAQCHAKLLGGTQADPGLGVWLDIDPPGTLLSRLKTDRPSIK